MSAELSQKADSSRTATKNPDSVFYLRRDRDSNPGFLKKEQRFSRPPRSTALASLQFSFNEIKNSKAK